MDDLEYIKVFKLGKFEFGFMAALKFLMFGLAIDLREDGDYHYSVSLGLTFISFSFCKPKIKSLPPNHQCTA